MKYIVELNPHDGSCNQLEVEAPDVVQAVRTALGRAHVYPETIDGERESSYRAEAGGQPWQRVTINVLPGGFVEHCEHCGERIDSDADPAHGVGTCVEPSCLCCSAVASGTEDSYDVCPECGNENQIKGDEPG